MKIPDMWDAALEGRLKGLWIIGYDVAQTDPNLKKVREALVATWSFWSCRICS